MLGVSKELLSALSSPRPSSTAFLWPASHICRYDGRAPAVLHVAHLNDRQSGDTLAAVAAAAATAAAAAISFFPSGGGEEGFELAAVTLWPTPSFSFLSKHAHGCGSDFLTIQLKKALYHPLHSIVGVLLRDSFLFYLFFSLSFFFFLPSFHPNRNRHGIG